jgi:hypothetical protein
MTLHVISSTINHIIWKVELKVTHDKFYLHIFILLALCTGNYAQISSRGGKTSKKNLAYLERKVGSTEKCELLNNKNLL